MTFLREIQLKRDLGSLRKNGLDTHKQTIKRTECTKYANFNLPTNKSKPTVDCYYNTLLLRGVCYSKTQNQTYASIVIEKQTIAMDIILSHSTQNTKNPHTHSLSHYKTNFTLKFRSDLIPNDDDDDDNTMMMMIIAAATTN